MVWEWQYYERAVAEATADLPECERLDAALRVIVAYQQSYPGLRMIDIEPAHVIKRLSRVIPLMRHRLERLAPGPDPALAVRRPSAWRFRTTWSAATMTTTS